MNKKIHRYIMVFRKPERLQTNGLTRAQKYNLLKNHAISVRRQLEDWLAARHLTQQVERIEPETMFNVIFIDATENVGEILDEFPESLQVGEDLGLTVEPYQLAV